MIKQIYNEKNIPPETLGAPKFLILLFFVEMWERFSYYGMRALLVLFLTTHLGFQDAKAYSIYSLFAAIAYSYPLLGGFLADKFMGFKNMVLIGGIIMILGHTCMTLVSLNPEIIYLGLSLIAVGTGLFKGNIGSLLGSCYEDSDPSRDKGFTIFYVGINLGSFLAAISCGYVATIYGWDYGFGLAGIGMVIGLIAFIKFQYVLGEKSRHDNDNIMHDKFFLGMSPFVFVLVMCLVSAFLVSKILSYSELFANVLSIIGLIVFSFFGYYVIKSPKEQRESLIAISIMIFFLMCFFGIEMQLGSLISLFTERNIQNNIFGINIPASVSQAINPLSIILLGFFVSICQKNKKYISFMPLFGILGMVICFLILYVGCLNHDENAKVSYMYLVLAISFMSLGELFIAPIVYSQTTLLAPKNARGFIMGILLLALAFSNLAGIVISKFVSVDSVQGKVDYFQSLEVYREGFLNIAIFNFVIAILFLFFVPFLKKVLARYN